MANNSQGTGGAQTMPPVSARPSGLRSVLNSFLVWREASVILVAVLLVIYFEVTNGNFISGANVVTLSQFVAAPAIIACGEIMLLICRQIDLSAGQTFALAPFLVYFGAKFGLPVIPAIVVALLLCAAIGLAIGLVTVMLDVPSFVTTLGAFFLITGITLTISRGFPATPPGGPVLAGILGAYGYSEIIWAFLIVFGMHILLRHTRWGLHTSAVGGNEIAAAEAGININRIKVGNFILTAVLAGFTGIIEAYRVGSNDPLAGGANMMFFGVASGVIGGTALTGGSGTIIGGLIGAIVLGVLQDGFTLQGINAFLFDAIIGAAILIAMVVNIRLLRWQRGGAQ
ncbi:MAG TPA: ABC transporter permease [Acetobacteraceae bacterium]|nr:ABC transporter permease [Acetobacteraceae bacterium]